MEEILIHIKEWQDTKENINNKPRRTKSMINIKKTFIRARAEYKNKIK